MFSHNFIALEKYTAYCMYDSGPDSNRKHRQKSSAQMGQGRIFLSLKLQFYHYDSVNISLVDRPKSS